MATVDLPNPERVRRHIARNFQVLEDDSSITEFGVTGAISDPKPLVTIPRADFPRLAIAALVPEVAEGDDSRRHQDHPAKLVIIKAIFERSDRRWQFVWNGIRISAPIRDQKFFVKMAAREYQFAQGDILSVTLRIYQARDEESGVFSNERYEVLEVHGVEHALPQTRLGVD